MTTIYTASQNGEHPTGLHWTAGETRRLTPEQAEGAPAWLVAEVPAPVVAVPPPSTVKP